MAIDYRDLTKDENFWRTEKDISKKAQIHIKELSQIVPFDTFKLSPKTYDVRNQNGGGDGGGTVAKASQKQTITTSKNQKGKAVAAPA